MRRTYLGAVCGEPGSYGILFLDVPGCTSSGETLEAVLKSGAEALTGHLDLMVENDGLLPVATVHEIRDVIDWLADNSVPIDETWVGVYPISVDVQTVGNTVAIRVKSDLVQRIADMATETASRMPDSRAFIEHAVEDAIARHKRAA